ncbi:DUF1499 domain-containing protein [Clostridium estertheticum]|uniref:DUF1499 domain-containing protein n=1 Tax=Clostridium estertheticum TaxID=238834 RepID=UPI0013E972F4|nr:DUF1499 domain-containing protein [Clostridium estertheticum]MBZ9687198.1 DUF1499 domain-containing protein [Clostridium estertheticum]
MKILTGVIGVMGAIVIYMVVKNNLTPNNLGVTNGKLAQMPNKPNAVSSQTEEKDKKVEPLEFKGNLNDSKQQMIKVIENYGNAKIVKNDTNYIYVVFTTGIMKYHDDVEFYFDESKKLIQIRSASRIGYSDMGLNRERYNKLRELYYK